MDLFIYRQIEIGLGEIETHGRNSFRNSPQSMTHQTESRLLEMLLSDIGNIIRGAKLFTYVRNIKCLEELIR
ncbi:hypothetical protein DSCO28_44840 [Desulfosarcina ovata subsp. sediminis]|uniref:Uncharacterized protein n=1 Tax=Desulfosarcina ovata subsp. sediminis TaxID=885957 RepID=A0A5K7ZUN3_9BACT|nr:hypothetical protein DSCO28_44840 [Desulfosarcina ovata subsp. sediminis]